MNPQTHIGKRVTKFWATATLGVPVLLSASLLLTLALEMGIAAANVPRLTSGLVAIAVIEALLITGSVWGTRKGTDAPAGSTVAAGIIRVPLIAGPVLTL